MIHLKGAGYVEAFLRMDLSEYLDRVSAVRRPSRLPGARDKKCTF